MSGAHGFVARLTRAGKGYKEIKETVNAAFGDKTPQKTAIYDIIKKVNAGKDSADQRHLKPKKTVRTAALVASVAAALVASVAAAIKDRRVMIESLAAAHGASLHTIHRILHEDLGLEKKTTRWVPRVLSTDQKEERVSACTELVAAIQRYSVAMMDQILTVNETMVCYHTPETKRQSKQ